MNKKADKRHLIMKAAEGLFTTRRFHEITMDDIAARAEVAKGTLYLYFRDKEDLFAQTCTTGLDELCALLDKEVPNGAPFQEQLLGACRQIGDFFERRHQLLRMMQAEESRMPSGEGNWRNQWLERRKSLVSAVAGILAKGVRDGHIRTDIPAEVLANILLGMLRARGRDMIGLPAELRRHEVVVDLFCRGAGTTRAQSRPEGRPSENAATRTEEGATS